MRISTFVACVVVAGSCRAAPVQSGDVLDVHSLSWLTGSWVMVQGDRRIEERWSSPSDDGLLGSGRTIQGGRTVFFEFLRIELRADGIWYIAQPKGGPGTEFRLVEHGAERVTFANPKHDHPQRITYRRNADGSLTARVEGVQKGEPVVEEFPYVRGSD